jgi:hypothetical protein
MKYHYEKVSRGALARVESLPDRAIFWGLVSTVVLVAVAMLKGMHW